MNNVLLTSVGRRSYLVEYFKQALGDTGKVICANMYADAAGMYVADHAAVVPASCDDKYIPAIIDLCHQYQIKLICSFHDLDAFVLSQYLNELRQTGAVPVLPSADWGRITLDKYECSCLLQNHGFNIPWTSVCLEEAVAAIAGGKLRFPVLIKARLGFGSMGLHICHSMDKLNWAYNIVRQQIIKLDNYRYAVFPADQGILIQQLIEGKEYCIDIVNDLTGQYACHFICEIHAMRAGESDMATTVDPALAGELPMRLSVLTKHLGIWGVDCMDDQGVLRVIDINPRFTGDYPFHHVAGANIPAALIAWAKGLIPDPDWLTATVGVKGYKDLVPKIQPHH